MNKKKSLILIITSIIVITIVFSSFYKKYQIKHAIKIVELSKKEVEVYENIRLKNLIKNINGDLLDNPKINTKELGKRKINFEYITDKGIKVPYTIEINIVDKTPPIISQINTFSVTVGYEGDIAKELFCGDNYDNNPKCTIEGKFDLNTVGAYDLTFIGEDSSKNKSTKKFTLNVKEKSTSNKNSHTEIKFTNYDDIVKDYKSKKTKIGIDVSHWQGDIDFKKIKAAGVEFVYIRVGRGDGINGEYILDDKFKQNIEGFNKVGIPVGIYFYSYANSIKDAENEAKWVIKQVKKYQVDLEIVFDWENWDSFQEFDLSFHKLTTLAKAFNKIVESKGYKSMLYSSKNYLENIWEPMDSSTWLAHYTKETDYNGKYKLWQICNNGKISGIDNLVDINVMYD